MIMAQPFGNGPDGTQWVKTGIPVGFQTYTGGKRPRAQPFGNGPDGTQWVETGIPVGFQTYVDGHIQGGPSPYPFFIKSQQDECPNLPKSYKLFESVCVRSDINVIPTVLGKINLIPIDAPRLTNVNDDEPEPEGTNPETVSRANNSFSVLRGMTSNVEQGVENTDQKIDSIIVLLDDMQQILTTISGDNTMEGGTAKQKIDGNWVVYGHRTVSDSKAQKLKAQQDNQPQTDDNANNHFTDLNHGLTNVNGIIAKTNPKIDSIIVRLDDMEQKLARIPNGKNGNSGNNGNNGNSGNNGNNGNNGNSGNNGNIEGGGHRRYTSRMKKRVKSRRNR